jgi:hypothetical protein
MKPVTEKIGDAIAGTMGGKAATVNPVKKG